MNKEKKEVKWVVQSNLTSTEDLNGLRLGCSNLNIKCLEVEIVPFTSSLPTFDIDSCNIYYGSTTFNNLIYENSQTRAGLFFNPETFSIENYINHWGRHMLNFGASITTFRELMHQKHDNEKLLFIRPNDDSKSFAGEVKRFVEIGQWYESLKGISNINLSIDSKIIVSEPYNIKSEWRLWIVNKKVVAASRYRQYFRLTKEKGCPSDVISFAELRCMEYTPHDVFVMDVCSSGDDYYIIECGCMNGAGFYKADINKIVESVTNYFRSICQSYPVNRVY